MRIYNTFLRLALFSLAGTLCLTARGAGNYSQLKAHWNFDEGRDWHNMPYPFNTPVKTAKDYVGNNDLLLAGRLDPVLSWVSGRQYSGIRFDKEGQLLKSTKPLNDLKGSCSLSYWIKTAAKGGNTPEAFAGIGGDIAGIIWGAINDLGELSVIYAGKPVASTKKPVNDDQWHHVVISRNAETGNVYLFLDGEPAGQGKTPAGEAPGEYAGFGAVKGAKGFLGVLDQIHLFDQIINKDTVIALQQNHAPKAYDLETLVSKAKPSVTGSILHLYTFDPDQDPVGVTRFGQGKSGTVAYNKDGTFTYTSGPGFRGTDKFPVTLSDGRGGYCSVHMIVRDETTVPRLPVTKFSSCHELTSPGTGGGSTGFRKPVVMDWDGDGKADILVAGNKRVWFYKNSGTRQKPGFDDPAEVRDASGKPLETDGIALYRPTSKARPSLVVRHNDGTLSLFDVRPSKGGASLTEKGKILQSDSSNFHCPSNSFTFGDYDNDGLADLLAGDNGGIYLYRNTGTASSPKFNPECEQIISNSYNLAPYFADLNGDGKIDLLHGINWGSVHYWLNAGKKNIMEDSSSGEISLNDRDNKMPMKGDNTILRHMNGTNGAFGDFNGDGIIDMVLGSYNDGITIVAYGVDVNAPKNNLALIEKIYRAHPRNLGQALEANNQELLKLYRNLSREWIAWAVSLPSVAARERAYEELKAHIKKFDFLKRKPLEAGIKRDKDGKVTEVGPMHHVPGIFTMNWVTLHCMLPDSAKHRLDVANTLGLKGLDREQYLKSGVALADNNKCTEGQLLAITDMMKYHPRVMFPDDHLSIDQHFGDGREAMAYVFKSNKNTFGNDVGAAASEMAGDLREPAERLLGKGSTIGDYFTLVMAHEVCHSMDAYVRERANQELAKRWSDMVIHAGNNGGANVVIAQDESGWMDTEKTKELFKTKNLWDGESSWDTAWKDYWDNCEYKDLAFMRGNIGWFIGAKQETLATQANHHWAGSESRLVGAIDRFNRGYKSNIHEVVLYLDFLSGGLNKMPMYNFEVTQNPNRVKFVVDKAWLERNDRGHITKITIGPRVYEFNVNEQGRVTGIKSHPFMNEMGSNTSS